MQSQTGAGGFVPRLSPGVAAGTVPGWCHPRGARGSLPAGVAMTSPGRAPIGWRGNDAMAPIPAGCGVAMGTGCAGSVGPPGLRCRPGLPSLLRPARWFGWNSGCVGSRAPLELPAHTFSSLCPAGSLPPSQTQLLQCSVFPQPPNNAYEVPGRRGRKLKRNFQTSQKKQFSRNPRGFKGEVLEMSAGVEGSRSSDRGLRLCLLQPGPIPPAAGHTRFPRTKQSPLAQASTLTLLWQD